MSTKQSSDEPIVLKANMNCICGRRIGWHLAELGLEYHNCATLDGDKRFGCGRRWKFINSGRMAVEVTGHA